MIGALVEAVRKLGQRRGKVDLEPVRRAHDEALSEQKAVIAEFRRVEQMVDATDRGQTR